MDENKLGSFPGTDRAVLGVEWQCPPHTHTSDRCDEPICLLMRSLHSVTSSIGALLDSRTALYEVPFLRCGRDGTRLCSWHHVIAAV